MERLVVPAVVAVVLVGTLAGLPATGLAAETATGTPAGPGSSDMAPGAQLAGVVGVEGAELEASVESRAFGLRVAAADTDRARAKVVADRTGALTERLESLEAENRRLEAARENGTISEDRYRAEVARLHAQSRALSRHTNETARTADRLPADLLRERGVDVEALRTLRSQAAELSGPERAAIARGVAGPGAGTDPGLPVRPGAGTARDAGGAGPPETGPSDANRTTVEPGASGGNSTGARAGEAPGVNRTERDEGADRGGPR